MISSASSRPTWFPSPCATAERSAPEQKVPSAPVRTATDSASSASNVWNASKSSRAGRAVDGVAHLRTIDGHDQHVVDGLGHQ